MKHDFSEFRYHACSDFLIFTIFAKHNQMFVCHADKQTFDFLLKILLSISLCDLLT